MCLGDEGLGEEFENSNYIIYIINYRSWKGRVE